MSDNNQFNDDDWIYTYQTGGLPSSRVSAYPTSASPSDPVEDNSTTGSPRFSQLRTTDTRSVLSPAQALQAVLQEQSLSSNNQPPVQDCSLQTTSYAFRSGAFNSAAAAASESLQRQPSFTCASGVEVQRPTALANSTLTKSVLTSNEQKQLIHKLQQQQRVNLYQKYQNLNRPTVQHITLAPQQQQQQLQQQLQQQQQQLQMQQRIRQASSLDRKISTPPCGGNATRNSAALLAAAAAAATTRLTDEQLVANTTTGAASSNTTHIQLLRNHPSLNANSTAAGTLILGQVDNQQRFVGSARLAMNNSGEALLNGNNGNAATTLSSRSSPLVIKQSQQTGSMSPAASTTDQINETVFKFKNFLATLLRLAHKDDTGAASSGNPTAKVNTLHQLICSLLEGSITTETFTRNLQQHFSSPHQPHLSPFLQRALPLVRQMYSTSTFMGLVIKHAKELIIKSSIGAAPAQQQSATSQQRPFQHASSTPATSPALMNGPSVVCTARVSGSTTAQPGTAPKISRQPSLHVTLPVEIKTNGGSLWLRPNPQRQGNVAAVSTTPATTINASTLQSIGPLVNITGLSISNRQRLSRSIASLGASQAVVAKNEPEVRTEELRITAEHLRQMQRQQLFSGLSECAADGESNVAVSPASGSATVIRSVSLPLVSSSPSSCISGARPNLSHVSINRGAGALSVSATPSADSPAISTSTTSNIITSRQQDNIGLQSVGLAEADDDLNDVTVMAGVNLLEEIKSCYQPNSDDYCQVRRLAELDEPGFLNIDELHKVCAEICQQEDIPPPGIEFAKFLSDFAEDLCRMIVRKSVDSARLRQHSFGRDNPNFVVVNETKRQLKFLESIKRSEHQRRDALERERLMKAAKSRSKFDDPESEKLKQQAKELEKQEIEERRQQEANETALAAIGRKRRKTGSVAGSDATVSSTPMSRQAHSRRNIRVTMSDLLRVLEPMQFPNKPVLMTYAYEGMFSSKPAH